MSGYALAGLDPPAIVAPIAVLTAIAGVVLARRPVRATTVDRFGRRYGLAQPPDRATVTAYLTTRRRWCTLGVTAAAVGELIRATPERIDVRYAVLGVGLLAGALVGEWRFRVNTAPTAGAVQRVPRLLTTVATGVTLVAVATTIGIPHLAAITPDAATLWGAAAVLVMITTIVAVQRIASGHRGSPDEAEAIAGSGMHSVTAYGVATALLCLAHALGVAQHMLLGATAVAAGQVSVVWTLTACVLLIGLGSAGWPERDPRVSVVAASAVALCVSVGILAHGILRDRPPYDAAAVDARATIVVADYEHHAAATGALGAADLPPVLGFEQVIYGRLDLQAPFGAPGQSFAFVLIDEQANRTAHVYGVDGGVWTYQFGLMPRQYPWLSALAAADGLALLVPADEPGQFAFTAAFPGDGPISADHLLGALVFLGPDEAVYWATPVPMTRLTLESS